MPSLTMPFVFSVIPQSLSLAGVCHRFLDLTIQNVYDQDSRTIFDGQQILPHKIEGYESNIIVDKLRGKSKYAMVQENHRITVKQQVQRLCPRVCDENGNGMDNFNKKTTHTATHNNFKVSQVQESGKNN